jgi:hypothetical protein
MSCSADFVIGGLEQTPATVVSTSGGHLKKQQQQETPQAEDSTRNSISDRIMVFVTKSQEQAASKRTVQKGSLLSGPVSKEMNHSAVPGCKHLHSGSNSGLSEDRRASSGSKMLNKEQRLATADSALDAAMPLPVRWFIPIFMSFETLITSLGCSGATSVNSGLGLCLKAGKPNHALLDCPTMFQLMILNTGLGVSAPAPLFSWRSAIM